MIRALIFDLDNCLAAAKEVGTELYETAFAAIRRANHGTVPDDKLKQAFADVWVHPFDWVAAKYGFSEEMRMAGWRELKTTEVTRPLHGYRDLSILAELEVQRFLVTSGFRRLQESKIKALNLNSLFTGIYVDAIDEPNRLGKEMLFRRIMQEFAFAAAEILIVGDNADSEIEAGNRLGIKTVQILRPGVSQASNATFHIYTLADLKKLLI
jgi:putative hydrolase of the HAD superfamily